MGITIRQYKRRGLEDGIEVEVSFSWPSGAKYRGRFKSPVSSRSGAKSWGEQRLREMLVQGEGRATSERAPTFGDFFERFLEGHCRANREKPSSIDSKERVWRNYLEPRFNNVRLDEITAEEVQALKGQMAAKKLSTKTTNNALSLLNGMLKAAHEWGVIREMPVRVRMHKVKVVEVKFYEPVAYARLLAAAEKIGPRATAVVLLGGEAGLRTGEMIGLKWSDIDFESGVITLRCSVWRGHTTTPKSGKPRTVPMTKRLADCLRSQRHVVREEVLYRQGGLQATRSSVSKWLLQAERRAGLEAVGSLHRLRHTFCSRLAENGAPAAALQALAGHSSYSTTARYVHLFEGAKESAIKLLEPQFGGIVEAPEMEGASAAG